MGVDVLAVMRSAAFELVTVTTGNEGRVANQMDQAREYVSDLIDGLTSAVNSIEAGGLDDLMCCDGRDCGCRAATNGDRLAHDLRTLLAKVTGATDGR